MAGEIVQASEPIPAHLANLVSKEQRNDFGPLKPQDFGMSFVKICQQQSPPTIKKIVPEGTIFCSRDNSVIPVGTPFIPLCRAINYIKWIGPIGQGKMEFSTSNEHDPRIKACDGLAFKPNPRTGKNDPPLVTQYTNFYVMVQGFDEPLLISYHKTSTPLGRKLTQDLFRTTKANTLPMYAVMYAFEQPYTKVEGIQQWLQMQVKYLGFTPPEALEKAKSMYELATTLRDASTGAEFVALEDTEEDSDTPTINATATVVETPPASVPPPQPQAAQTVNTASTTQITAPASQAPRKKLW